MTTNDNSGINQYIIQEGDTMWEIANQYNTSVESLMAFNPDVDPDAMLAGQVLNVPEQMPPQRPSQPAPTRPMQPPMPAYPRYDRTRRDWRDRRDWMDRRDWRDRRDWMDRRDWRYRRDWRDRRFPVRPWGRPYPRPIRPYYPGQRMCPRGTTAYYVQAGDSIYSIASQFRVSVDSLIAANPYINFNLPLQIGQTICIP